jgi:hypothetical protein
MHCNGKCYLAKQLKEQEKQDQKGPVSKKYTVEVNWFYVSEPIQIGFFHQDRTEEYQGVDLWLPSSYSHSLFRPPIII